METKICSKCKEEKLIDLFPIAKGVCKTCRKIYMAEWRFNNKEQQELNKKRYRLENREKYLARQKKWGNDNKDRTKQWRQNNAERLAAYKSQWQQDNRSRINDARRDREAIDINFKLSNLLRTRLCAAVRNNQKSGSAVKDLGCSIDELKIYLESKFQPGMSWGNYSHDGWHIDHIIPLSSFDLSDREQLLKACHYSNLQPLWAKDNLSKGARMPEGPNPL